MTITATAIEGDTLDAICWRELGRTRDVTEQVLEMNPGLAAMGPVLPAGTVITLPEPAQAAPAFRTAVQLWD